MFIFSCIIGQTIHYCNCIKIISSKAMKTAADYTNLDTSLGSNQKMAELHNAEKFQTGY